MFLSENEIAVICDVPPQEIEEGAVSGHDLDAERCAPQQRSLSARTTVERSLCLSSPDCREACRCRDRFQRSEKLRGIA